LYKRKYYRIFTPFRKSFYPSFFFKPVPCYGRALLLTPLHYKAAKAPVLCLLACPYGGAKTHAPTNASIAAKALAALPPFRFAACS